MKILVTGAAGFIGAALSKKLLESGFHVVGIDNLNDYYSPILKEQRLNLIEQKKGWNFYKISIEDKEKIGEIFLKYKPKVVINLAAQAGVRYSFENPDSYIQSNVVGFLNIIENCRRFEVENFIYASSSSVYGGNKKMPFSEDQQVDHPVSLYAATKKSNELIAHTYSTNFKIPSTGLRFFTVYGAWGRPDMSPMIFTKSILKKEPIEIFNYGQIKRDFTFIDDIVDGIYKVTKKKFIKINKKNDPSESFCPFRILNIGNNNPVPLMRYIKVLESELGVKSKKFFKPLQKGDVKNTNASIKKIKNLYSYNPNTKIEKGIKKFINWYREYFNV